MVFSKIQEIIKELSGEDKVLLGVSGGCDSLFLLLILIYRKVTENKELVCIFVNYELHHEETQNTKNKLEKIAEKYSFQFIPINYPPEEKRTESHWRDFRYKKFFQYAMELKCSSILTAHNKDDLIESILMRTYKGSGFYGIANALQRIVKGNIKIIRPLLHISRKEIEEVMEGIFYYKDPTNNCMIYERNRLRYLIQCGIKNNIDFNQIILTSNRMECLYSYLEKDIEDFIIKHGIISYYNYIVFDFNKFLKLSDIHKLILLSNCISFVSKKSHFQLEIISTNLSLLLQKKVLTLHACFLRILKNKLIICRDNWKTDTTRKIEENIFIWDNRFIIEGAKDYICTNNSYKCIGYPCDNNINHRICLTLPAVIDKDNNLVNIIYEKHKKIKTTIVQGKWFFNIPKKY